MATYDIFAVIISWSGLDIGLDRGTIVGDYTSPFTFTGHLEKVIVDLADDQALDHETAMNVILTRE